MQKKKPLQTIAILAGGKSSRMGENKARLNFEQTILLKRIIDDALSLKLTPFLCCDDICYPEISDVVISPDFLANKEGALSAIMPALEKCYQNGEKWLWVYACDSLVLPSQLLPYMQKALDEDCQIILPKIAKSLPLLAIYRTDLYQALRTYLESGERRVMPFCHQFKIQEIALPQEIAHCCNFNTQTEFKTAKEEYIKFNKK